jgi:hypothetical protein
MLMPLPWSGVRIWVAQTLATLPAEHASAVHNLTLTFDPDARRGLGGDNTVVLRCVNMTAQELVAVLIHEIGHTVDTGLIETESGEATLFLDRGTPVYDTDPSLEFYSASWIDEETWYGSKWNFVSGYARSNPYEEFAESYVLYVLNGQLFRKYATEKPVLAEKYDYLKEVVFEGLEYDLPQTTSKGATTRVYDVTRLDFDLESFLALRGQEDS